MDQCQRIGLDLQNSYIFIKSISLRSQAKIIYEKIYFLHFFLQESKLQYFILPLSVRRLQNKNIKMSSFKSSESIQKKEGGPDRSVSDNQSSSVTLNELAMKARKYCYFEIQQGSQTLTDMNLNGVQITKTV